jgi:hypothetical protein
MKWSSLVLLMSCATAPTPAPTPAGPPAPEPTARSSVGALLQHAVELQLTLEQRDRLGAIDDALLAKDTELRDEVRKRRDAAPAAASDTTGGSYNSSGSAGADAMNGMGSGRNGRGGRGSMGSVHHAAKTDPNSKEAVRAKIDDNDTAAFFEAEKSLTEEQKPRARELAGQYREELYNWRSSRDAHDAARDLE